MALAIGMRQQRRGRGPDRPRPGLAGVRRRHHRDRADPARLRQPRRVADAVLAKAGRSATASGCAPWPARHDCPGAAAARGGGGRAGQRRHHAPGAARHPVGTNARPAGCRCASASRRMSLDDTGDGVSGPVLGWQHWAATTSPSGADGAMSAIRRMIFPNGVRLPRFTGQGSWRIVAEPSGPDIDRPTIFVGGPRRRRALVPISAGPGLPVLPQHDAREHPHPGC